MHQDNRLRVKMCELPLILEVEIPNGEEIYEIKPTRNRLGVFLNKVSLPLRKFITRK
jgi:hypothetical protein